MIDTIKNYWRQLEPRERLILGWGGVIVVLILFHALVWQPWHKAIAHMEEHVVPMRANLVWMRQQSALLKNGGGSTASVVQGRDQSLMSVVEQTAKRSNVRDAIQQMVPGQSGSEVRVVLEGANFNNWVSWIDQLFFQYGVAIEQVTAERDDDEPNIAEIRVTFQRI